mmetsp:Transcript_93097/g.300950  ORF Transcript_93097/g.300950 Transcript_93097/m.300950 type:complete len:201 (+) Transcript_93097:1053-1655(+)
MLAGEPLSVERPPRDRPSADWLCHKRSKACSAMRSASDRVTASKPISRDFMDVSSSLTCFTSLCTSSIKAVCRRVRSLSSDISRLLCSVAFSSSRSPMMAPSSAQSFRSESNLSSQRSASAAWVISCCAGEAPLRTCCWTSPSRRWRSWARCPISCCVASMSSLSLGIVLSTRCRNSCLIKSTMSTISSRVTYPCTLGSA